MTAFDRAASWCDSLPRDKQGLPPCHGCVMHESCAVHTVPLTQQALDDSLERIGRDFERLVEGSQ